MEIDKIPFVDVRVVNYLKTHYTLNSLLDLTDGEEANFTIGFMNGVQEVINHLDAIVRIQEGE